MTEVAGISIPLTQGQIALVDADDYERVSQHKWFAFKNKKKFYAACKFGGRNLLMHRFILELGIKDSRIIDHINRNSLDNRRNNLRFADESINARNSQIWDDARGSYYIGYRKKWIAYHMLYGKRKFIGYFDTEKEAHEAYLEARENV